MKRNFKLNFASTSLISFQRLDKLVRSLFYLDQFMWLGANKNNPIRSTRKVLRPVWNEIIVFPKQCSNGMVQHRPANQKAFLLKGKSLLFILGRACHNKWCKHINQMKYWFGEIFFASVYFFTAFWHAICF